MNLAVLTFVVVNTLRLGGTGGWDYLTVDSENGLLYVPRSTHTMVVKAEDGKLLADIPGQKGNHGVALAAKAGRGFISDGGDASVVIFDLKTHQVLGKVAAEDDADGIIYDPSSNKVLCACGDANKLVVISPDVDPRAGKAETIDLGGKPEYLAAEEGKIYVNLVDKNQVAVIDSKTMKVVDKWSTKPGGQPVGLSIDPAKHRLFIGCRNPQKLIVMSTQSGKVLGDLPIGRGNDATAFFDGYAFASCGDGTLAVARETAPDKFQIVQTVTTKSGARTMGVDPKTKSIYLPTAEGAGRGRRGGGATPNSFMIVVVRANALGAGLLDTGRWASGPNLGQQQQ